VSQCPFQEDQCCNEEIFGIFHGAISEIGELGLELAGGYDDARRDLGQLGTEIDGKIFIKFAF